MEQPLINGNIFRFASSDQGTEGQLVLPSLGFTCLTLELPWRDNKPCVSCIPQGEYECTTVNSPHFKRVYHVKNVPDRSHVLIHAGNFAGDATLGLRTHVQGCILLGARLGYLHGQRAVLVSRATVRRFMTALDNKNIHLTITSAGG